MRADRLLSEILLLQSGKQMSSREIAKRLEISERTVHRDMESLSMAGVPVFAMRGSRGGWQLEEGWRMRVPGLDESELRALMMAQPRMIEDSRLAAAAERALNKLMAALPGPLHQQATSIRERLYVDATAWRASTENLAMLPIVQEAVSRDRKLKILYRKTGHDAMKASSAQERVVDPLGLVAKGTAWYLVANTAAGFRTFRVSRIEEATVLAKACVRPRNFDLATHWQSATDEFQKGWGRFEAVLCLEPRAAELMKMWRMTSPAPKVKGHGAEGWIFLKVQFDAEGEACFVVQGLGPGVEVVSPESLRERIVKNAAEIARKFVHR